MFPLVNVSRRDMVIIFGLPACPTMRKNHKLPERFKSRGTEYDGLRSRSVTAYHRDNVFLRSHDTFSSVRNGLAGDLYPTAALRMKGVVNPHAIPTTIKPKIKRIVEGEERSILSALSIENVHSQFKAKGRGRKRTRDGGWSKLGSDVRQADDHFQC